MGVLRGKRNIAAQLLLVISLLGLTAGCSSSNQDHAAKGSAASTSARSGMPEAKADSAAPAAKESASSADRSIGKPAPGTSEKTSPPSEGIRRGQQQDVRPGQLTAGEWSDLKNWDWWQNLMNKKEWAKYQTDWGMRTYQRFTVEVRSGGRQVADAEVALIGGNGQHVWKTRTNQRGEAVVFAGVTDGPQEGPFKIQITSGQQTKTVDPVNPGGKLPLVVNLETPGVQAASRQVDIMFVVDTTGSMADELNFLSAELKDVIERVRSDNGNQLGIRLSSNFYRDHGDEYVVRSYPFTTDVDDVVKKISQQRAYGGGDYEEAVEEALQDAIHNHNWSGEARARLLFLVLDAPPHLTPSVVKKMQALTAAAAEKGIRIIPIASSGVDKNTEMLLRIIDILTGGTYIFLTDHSGIGDSHIEPTIGDYQVELLNKLLVKTINSYIQ
ncbi:vWA domain-containing protein [Paenibacillus thalictri]|uniref:vWA domain-containing protein n=1 Tax=Paenibacillus thalictri TaxID=2527873 RepID=UPI001F0F8223|nr:vWA domain-containing protein [Paenibacillus thalictri]